MTERVRLGHWTYHDATRSTPGDVVKCGEMVQYVGTVIAVDTNGALVLGSRGVVHHRFVWKPSAAAVR